jgi:gluconokinase
MEVGVAESETVHLFVVMGVSGSGKTTIGTLLAEKLGAPFADADDFHSPENKAKMHAGTPLTDEDRAPWLHTLNGVLLGWQKQGTSGVLACSALKDAYRHILNDNIAPGVLRFVWLDLSKEQLAARLAARQHTFMNPALLDSQLATLEVPAEALRVVNDRKPEQVVAEILEKAGLPH